MTSEEKKTGNTANKTRTSGSIALEALEKRTLLSTSAATILTPTEVRTAYGFNQVLFTSGNNSVAATGAGQTIAIVDAFSDPTITSDLKTFDSTFGISNNDASGKFVLSIATPQGKVNTDAGWSLEQSLDVEWAHAIAPQADILLVQAKSASYSDLMAAVAWARKQSGVVAVSMSWGGMDFNGEQVYDQDFTTPTNHVGGSGLKGGITYVAAAGDNGSPSGYPATSPNVLSVGGTVLSTDTAGDYLGETAWSDGGGGISAIEGTKVPDVSYNAGTGYYVYDSTKYNGSKGWWSVGGTSAGAPQWAALIALADQGLALKGVGSLDGPTQTIPQILAMPESNFNDITTGSNGTDSAGPGYDLVTGMGSPIAPAIIASLVGSQHSVASTSSTNTVSNTSSQTQSTGSSRHHHSNAAAAPIASTTPPLDIFSKLKIRGVWRSLAA